MADGMNAGYQVVVGDCREALRTMREKSVHTCVTSPPYYGLRDYGVAGQLGLEPTPSEFVAALVGTMREVRRVLRDDGTLWLNLGDSYASNGGHSDTACNDRRGAYNLGNRPEHSHRAFRARGGGCIKQKDLIGIPWRVAFALQADGWHLRQDIIWAKTNPMPESVRDRCTKAHEYLFLLSKGPRYYFDHEAIKERAIGGASSSAASFRRTDSGKRSVVHPGQRNATHRSNRPDVAYNGEMRNRRSVWSVPTKPFKGAHFATFPPDLIEPCVLAGCPVGGTVLDPFGGSGTTAGVAVAAGRNAILCELNPAYAAMIPARVQTILDRRSKVLTLLCGKPKPEPQVAA